MNFSLTVLRNFSALYNICAHNLCHLHLNHYKCWRSTFLQTKDMLKLIFYVAMLFCVQFSPLSCGRTCPYDLLRHRNNWETAPVFLAGDVLRSREKHLVSSPQARRKLLRGVFKNIQRFHGCKCRNVVLSCGRWLGSHLVCDSTIKDAMNL